jgi:hypothetical protein
MKPCIVVSGVPDDSICLPADDVGLPVDGKRPNTVVVAGKGLRGVDASGKRLSAKSAP